MQQCGKHLMEKQILMKGKISYPFSLAEAGCDSSPILTTFNFVVKRIMQEKETLVTVALHSGNVQLK